MLVHGKSPVGELADALSEVDNVASVLVSDEASSGD